MLKRLKELMKNVQLPWKLEPPEKDGRILQCDPRETIVHVPPCDPHNEDAIADRELMVLMANSAPRLIALFEALEEFRESWMRDSKPSPLDGNRVLSRYYELKLWSLEEIDDYVADHPLMKKLEIPMEPLPEMEEK